ncbi:hypothetical protein OUZ56_022508 [Daphnia magna]|uniref:Uncharacterized protein n=1 Tax=Daphnia magna TaxID=35525 RepID=A0ABR0AWK9_9CRUS|nr:hypothetical protein OUZ56_022508 [Daphnia magna]
MFFITNGSFPTSKYFMAVLRLHHVVRDQQLSNTLSTIFRGWFRHLHSTLYFQHVQTGIRARIRSAQAFIPRESESEIFSIFYLVRYEYQKIVHMVDGAIPTFLVPSFIVTIHVKPSMETIHDLTNKI